MPTIMGLAAAATAAGAARLRVASRPRGGQATPLPGKVSGRCRALAARRARPQRLVLLLTGCVSVLTLVVSGGAWALTGYVSSGLHRVNADTTGTPSSGPVNILVAGVDSRKGLTHEQKLELHVGSASGLNSDSLMLVHIPANHSGIDVVSIPRDSWVDLPGYGMNKINAAIGFGGPALMVRTVEQVTGLTINDYVEVDFTGFVRVVDAMGGVDVCVPYAVDDPYSGLDLPAGMHHVDGITALEFARDRHSFALSDLSRISDQQQLLSTLFSQATKAGVLANPVQFDQVVSSVTAAVVGGQGFQPGQAGRRTARPEAAGRHVHHGAGCVAELHHTDRPVRRAVEYRSGAGPVQVAEDRYRQGAGEAA